jgi:hypothetical protein
VACADSRGQKYRSENENIFRGEKQVPAEKSVETEIKSTEPEGSVHKKSSVFTGGKWYWDKIQKMKMVKIGRIRRKRETKTSVRPNTL